MASEPGGDGRVPSVLAGGRYRVRGVLGHGSQAETFDAEDTRGGTSVAIKRFSVRGAKSWKDVELAEREARVLSELSHPSLPKYIEHFEEDGALYLVMEKIEGQTLAELRRTRALTQRQVASFLTDIAETLAYLHGRSPPIIHRDIKPQNVILRPNGSFALVDFGSVRDRLRPEGGSTVVGTFGYMAPEQFQGRALPATDAYGVGATALACLSGQDPDKLPHRGLALDVKAALGKQVDARFVDLLSELLDPDPDRRPADLRARVRQALAGEPRKREAPNAANDARRDAYAARDSYYAAREQWRQQKRARRDERHARRDEARRARYAQRGQRAPIAPPILLVVTLALFVARVATFGLFRFFLPLVLAILALFFGGNLRRAAERCMEIGRAGEDGLRHALSQLWSRARLPQGRVNEADAQRVRIDVVDTTAEVPSDDDEHARDPHAKEEPPARRRV